MNNCMNPEVYFEDDTREIPEELFKLPPEELERQADELLSELKRKPQKRVISDETLKIFTK